MPEDGWIRLQQDIDGCQECRCLGAELLVDTGATPARPPGPSGGELVFLSEAPPPTGGFWVPPPATDDLRGYLFSVLGSANVVLPQYRQPGCLEAFIRHRLFLLQTIKWPLRESARGLRPRERSLIEHSAKTHLVPELLAIRPTAIVAMGKVACYACARILQGPDFAFDSTTRLTDVQGKDFEVFLNGGPVRLYATALPVRRRRKAFQRISGEIRRAVVDHRLAELVRRLVAAYRPERIYLFGSHARRDAGPDSDYDLLVVVPDSAAPERRRSRLAYVVLRGTGTAVDVLVQSRTHFDGRLHLPASLPATVAREGRLLYAA